jgi:outer membrane protein X
MKKIFLFLVLSVISSIGAYAGTGDMALAVKFDYASKYSQPGLGFEYQLSVVDNVRLAPEFNYYFKNDGVSTWDMNFNVQYVIYPFSNFSIYPFAGFSYTSWDYDYADNVNKAGANIGCGAEYRISPKVSFITEERFLLISDRNQSITSFGLKFRF